MESPATHGRPADGSTLAREACFLDLASKITADAALPIMLTGGIRRRPVAEEVLGRGVSMVGMARALAVDPDLPRRWLQGEDVAAEDKSVNWKDKTIADAASQAAVRSRISRLNRAGTASARVHPVAALIGELAHRRVALRRYRRWLER